MKDSCSEIVQNSRGYWSHPLGATSFNRNTHKYFKSAALSRMSNVTGNLCKIYVKFN